VIGVPVWDYLVGDMAAFASYGGSFIGMGSQQRLEGGLPWSTPRSLLSYALAGALGGMVHKLCISIYTEGWGGMLGFCSMVGFVLFSLMAKALHGAVVYMSLRRGGGGSTTTSGSSSSRATNTSESRK